MKNKKIIILVVVISLVLLASLGGFLLINSNSKDKNQLSSQAVNGSEKVANLDLKKSDSIPLGGGEKSDDQSVLKVTNGPASNPANLGSGNRINNSGSSSSSANSSNSSAPGPESFGEYEKYKNAENSLFGDLKVGNGSEAVSGKKVAVYYKGWLSNGQLFDESVNSTFVFTLGQRQVITGWEQSIIGMKIGGIRRIIVPPAVGYGDQAKGPIPANSVLVFDVQLVAVE